MASAILVKFPDPSCATVVSMGMDFPSELHQRVINTVSANIVFLFSKRVLCVCFREVYQKCFYGVKGSCNIKE
ncbi:unnamed protein product [Camellia sinensis]